MSIYIDGLEMPTEGNETIIRIQPDGVVLDQYGHHLDLTAIVVPKHDGPLISGLVKRRAENTKICFMHSEW